MGWPGPMTHLQFAAWQEWLFIDLNTPSRDNYYQMKIAFEARYSNRQPRSDATPDEMQIKFKRAGAVEKLELEKIEEFLEHQSNLSSMGCSRFGRMTGARKRIRGN